MLLLAIDTALEACSVGLSVAPDEPPTIRSEIIGRGHAERLPVLLGETVEAAGVAWKAIERIAVTVGPGSFTGLRIGVATARGLALSLGCEAIGVTTLAAHAEAARPEIGHVPVLALLPASGGMLYGEIFAADGSVRESARVESPAYYAGLVGEDGALRIVGEGASRLAAGREPSFATRIVHRRSAPDVSAILRLGRRAPAGARPSPLYLKPPDAVPPDAAVARR